MTLLFRVNSFLSFTLEYNLIFSNIINNYLSLRPYHSVHADQTTFSRFFQNTMYIDIGKYMSIQNTCHNRTIICIESFFFI